MYSRHMFKRLSSLPQAPDCIVSSLLIWGEIEKAPTEWASALKKHQIHCRRAFILQNTGGISNMLIQPVLNH